VNDCGVSERRAGVFTLAEAAMAWKSSGERNGAHATQERTPLLPRKSARARAKTTRTATGAL